MTTESPVGRCRKCKLPITGVRPRQPGASVTWTVTDTNTTADGLSYCPPNPDHDGHIGKHQPCSHGQAYRKYEPDGTVTCECGQRFHTDNTTAVPDGYTALDLTCGQIQPDDRLVRGEHFATHPPAVVTDVDLSTDGLLVGVWLLGRDLPVQMDTSKPALVLRPPSAERAFNHKPAYEVHRYPRGMDD